MRRKLKDIKDTLAEFVDQADHLLLVIGSTDTEMMYVLKTLDGLDEQDAADLFLLFGSPLESVDGYVAEITRVVNQQIAEMNNVKRERGESEWPHLPAICSDLGQMPELRLRAVIDHLSRFLPPEGDHRLVIGLLPIKVTDREGFSRLIYQFIPWRGPEPYMRRLRILARDDRANPFLVPVLREHQVPGVLIYEPDMSPEAMTDDLVKDIADEELPVGDRMQALVQLAAMDYAYGRFPQAVEKYGILYNYFDEHKARAMQGVVLQGVGDILRRTGDPRGAKERYEQGLGLALEESRAVPVLFNLTYALGDVSLELKEFAEAESYLDLSQQLATKLLNPYAKGDAMEKLGIARWERRDYQGAMAIWQEAVTLCRTFNYKNRHAAVLERLGDGCGTLGMAGEREVWRKELCEVRTAIKNRTAERGHA